MRFLGIFSGMSVYARPHPGPLPRGEGEHIASLDNFSIFMAVTDSVSLAVRHEITQIIACLKTRRTIPPLPGERVGVRAGVIPDFRAAPEASCFTSRHPLKTLRRLK
jgi:hypothetical protein